MKYSKQCIARTSRILNLFLILYISFVITDSYLKYNLDKIQINIIYLNLYKSFSIIYFIQQ